MQVDVRDLGWEHPLEKEMATDSSRLAWEIPWTEEPGGLQSMGSQGVNNNNKAGMCPANGRNSINSPLEIAFMTFFTCDLRSPHPQGIH